MEAHFEGGQGPEGAVAPYMEWKYWQGHLSLAQKLSIHRTLCLHLHIALSSHIYVAPKSGIVGSLLPFLSMVSCRGEFRPRQTRQLPRAVDLKGRLLS